MTTVESKVREYQQRIEELFAEWKNTEHHTNEIFVEDGVVCPEKWFAREVRPLFLLKEAYGGNNGWSLINDYLIKDDSIEGIWRNVSLWTKGLLNTNAEHLEAYNPNDAEFNKFNNEYIKYIAVVNVKKSKGEKSSDYEDILNYAKSDKKFLLQQLEICDPTIIVCGYTIDPLIEILEKNIKTVHNDNLSYHITLNDHDVLILDYWHPGNQFPKVMNYYGLVNIYQQALLKND